MGQLCRAADMRDLPAVLEILSQGREYLRQQGVNQWQDADGYPDPGTVRADIARGEASAVCSLREESTYRHIVQGAWKPQGPYAVIHRAASAASARRLGAMSRLLGALLDCVQKKGLRSVRIDTHEDNRPMRCFLKRMGFLECGIIRLSSGVLRVAYERPFSAQKQEGGTCQNPPDYGKLDKS